MYTRYLISITCKAMLFSFRTPQFNLCGAQTQTQLLVGNCNDITHAQKYTLDRKYQPNEKKISRERKHHRQAAVDKV